MAGPAFFANVFARFRKSVSGLVEGFDGQHWVRVVTDPGDVGSVSYQYSIDGVTSWHSLFVPGVDHFYRVLTYGDPNPGPAIATTVGMSRIVCSTPSIYRRVVGGVDTYNPPSVVTFRAYTDSGVAYAGRWKVYRGARLIYSGIADVDHVDVPVAARSTDLAVVAPWISEWSFSDSASGGEAITAELYAAGALTTVLAQSVTATVVDADSAQSPAILQAATLAAQVGQQERAFTSAVAEDLQTQNDAKLMFYYSIAASDPAAAWQGSDALVKQHNDDYWKQTDTGLWFIFRRVDVGVGVWDSVVDGPAVDALNDAASAANEAVVAQDLALNAQSAADVANAELTTIASDDILSAIEKPSVVLDYTNIVGEQSGIVTQASSYGVSSTAYQSAVSALTAYLGTLTGWNVIPGSNVVIVGTDFRAAFALVYSTRESVLNAIAAAAKVLADTAQTTANAKNSGFATLASAQASAVIGDVFVDNGIQYRVAVTPSASITVSNSTRLSAKRYADVADATARGALTGMLPNDTVYQIDTKTWYYFTSSWQQDGVPLTPAGVGADPTGTASALTTQLANQVDHAVTYWYNADASDPAAAWTSDALKTAHNGDYWKKATALTWWRYARTGVNAGSWAQIVDGSTLMTLNAAQLAQATANSKDTVWDSKAAADASAVAGDLYLATGLVYRWTSASVYDRVTPKRWPDGTTDPTAATHEPLLNGDTFYNTASKLWRVVASGAWTSDGAALTATGVGANTTWSSLAAAQAAGIAGDIFVNSGISYRATVAGGAISLANSTRLTAARYSDVANDAAKTALTGMIAYDTVYQTDKKQWYFYNAGWQLDGSALTTTGIGANAVWATLAAATANAIANDMFIDNGLLYRCTAAAPSLSITIVSGLYTVLNTTNCVRVTPVRWNDVASAAPAFSPAIVGDQSYRTDVAQWYIYSASGVWIADGLGIIDGVATYTPHYLRRFAWNTNPATTFPAGHFEDTALCYDAEVANCGIYRNVSGTWTKQATPTTEMCANAWQDILWAVANNTPTLASAGSESARVQAYMGTGVNYFETLAANVGFFSSLYAVQAFIDGIFTKYLKLTSGGKIESSTFSAGSAGFQLKDDGSAEFNNVTLRGFLLYPSITSGTALIIKSTTTLFATNYTSIVNLASGWGPWASYQIMASGTVNVVFNLYGAGGATAYARIYVNNIAVGTLRSTTSTTPVAFSETISVTAGDLIQLYGYSSSASFNASVNYFALKIASPYVALSALRLSGVNGVSYLEF